MRIQTLDGEIILGHTRPAILIRDLELMKQERAKDPATSGYVIGHAAGAGSGFTS